MTNFYDILRSIHEIDLPRGEPFNCGGVEHGLEWELSDGSCVSLYANGIVTIGDGTFDSLEFTNVLLTMFAVAKAKQDQVAQYGEEKLRVQ